jgi:membrane protease YdiL (CAAX protease family)
MEDLNSKAISTDNPEPEKEVWGPWATAGFGALVLVISFFVQVVVAVGFALVWTFSAVSGPGGLPDYGDLAGSIMDAFTAHEGFVVAIATIASGIVCLAFIVLIVKVRRGLSVSEYLAYRSMNVKTGLIAVGVLVAFLAASGLFNTYTHVTEGSDFVTQVFDTSYSPWLLGVAVVVVAPFFEESLVRGMLYEGFRRSRLGVAGAIIITSAVWSVLHLQYGWYEIGSIFVLGLVLGVVRYKTNTLWSTILMHALFNLSAILLVAFVTTP